MAHHTVHSRLPEALMDVLGDWDPFTLLNFASVHWLPRDFLHLDPFHEVEGHHTVHNGFNFNEVVFRYLTRL